MDVGIVLDDSGEGAIAIALNGRSRHHLIAHKNCVVEVEVNAAYSVGITEHEARGYRPPVTDHVRIVL